MADATPPDLDTVLAELGSALKAQAASPAVPQTVAEEDISSLALVTDPSPKDRLAIEQAAPGSPALAGVELGTLDARFAAQGAEQIKAAFASVLPAIFQAAQGVALAALTKAGG